MLLRLFGVRLVTFVGGALFVLAGCNGLGSGALTGGSTPAFRSEGPAGHISHVVIIVQENRSFENFFAGYPGANAPMVGCGVPQKSMPTAGARLTTSSTQCPKGDKMIPLHQVTFQREPNLYHTFQAGILDWNKGRMDGFSHWGLPGKYFHTAAYAYIERSQVKPYWDIANQYVLADAMFPTEFGPSWTAHLTIVAGTDTINKANTLALADFADGGHSNCKSPPQTTTTTVNVHRVVRRGNGPFPCLDQFNTMAQTLDNAGVSWKYYTSQKHKSFIWSPFSAIKYVFDGPDWDNNIIQPQTQVLKDIQAGTLASVSWVTPTWKDSDHPGAHSDTGPSWVATVVNAVGESQYWDSTAIIVLWDDFGGFYDNAAPPQLDFRGLAVRIPCLIISPYAKKGYVSHTQYEYGSILKFIEETFPGVKHLGPTSEGYTDTRAHTLSDSFDFQQSPRPFQTIAPKYPPSYFEHEAPSDHPVDNY